MLKQLEAGVVTPIYRIPYKRKRLEGNAILLRPIHIGEQCDLWEVEFMDVNTENKPWRWIWKDKTAPDDQPPPKVYGKGKKKK